MTILPDPFVAKAATTSALPACTLSGSGTATLTATSNGAFPSIDGITIASGDIIAVKNQSDQKQNGAYTLTTVGDASHPWVLTWIKIQAIGNGESVYCAVAQGTTNAGSVWCALGGIIGTDNFTFVLSGVSTDAQLQFSDITTNNSSTSNHGFLKKLDNNAAHYMDGTGNWSSPSALSGPGLGSSLQPQMSVVTTTGSGTFTTSANITSSTKFKFTLVGAGGGGGGVSTAGRASGGGGAGATCIYEVSGLSASTGYTINVGAGGAAGSTGGGAGGTGGNTTITIGGTTVTANGGNGGGGSTGVTQLASAGGAGGTGSNGTANINGGDGQYGMILSPSGYLGGIGGASSMGGGGKGGGTVSGAVTGTAGEAYGSGGGGTAVGNGTGVAGGAGAQGILIAEWSE